MVATFSLGFGDSALNAYSVHGHCSSMGKGKGLVGTMKRDKFNKEFPQNLRSHEFLRLAYDFHRAYLNCIELMPPNAPKYFLGCHAIELALKSYLLSVGVPIEDIVNVQKYGHDIDKLLNDALEKNLILTEDNIGHIRRLNEVHSKFWNRYPIEWADPIYIVDQNDSAISNLLKAVDPYQRNEPFKND